MRSRPLAMQLCMPERPIPAVVLAAGASSRLGQPKQLLQSQGESLVRRAVVCATEAGFAPVYVVVGAHAERVSRALDGVVVQVVQNPEWQLGMSTSLHYGVRAAMKDGVPEDVLLLVCDQPRISSELLRRMREGHLRKRSCITAAKYGGSLGVPAIFSQAYFGELESVAGDRGARAILMRHSAEVDPVPFEGGAFDIDTPEDLERWKASEQK